jgi:FkbM family methyltransferase
MIIEFLKHFRYTKSIYWSYFLYKKKIPIEDYFLDNKNDLLKIRSVDHFFKRNDYPVYFDSYSNYNWLFKENNIQLVFSQEKITVHVNGLKLQIETNEDFFIINEIFVDNVYNIASSKSTIVIDVGMNIALTSLFFASKNFVKKVYAFEPVLETFNVGMGNIIRNNHVSDKITTYNYGLAAKTESKEVLFDYSNKGKTSLFDNSNNYTLAKKKIYLKKASDEINKIIIQNNQSLDMFLKLDCEGSEFEIIDDLNTHSLLQHFKVIVLEWHLIDGNEISISRLMEILNKNEFIIIQIGTLQKDIGLIYSIKR